MTRTSWAEIRAGNFETILEFLRESFDKPTICDANRAIILQKHAPWLESE